ncbi:MAG TPA: cytochrome c oxidase accessory protein CcoG [Rhodocyclaceae bacterium]|nr:cytochrome c oxidase accessory protein CcoG [Rhodocyclaceae bacterium]HNH34709.1 cytochrome c oxidase accessory protein CcoG [Rhodocyclaceae bacterium]
MNQPYANEAVAAADPTGAAAAGAAPTAVPLYAKRRKLQVKSVSGFFSRWRWAMVWLTQAIFYGLCWMPWNGRQAVLFDIVERKFYLFGLVLWPQDVLYLSILLIVSAYGLFLFTAIGGRLFCGYACPQTVYTELLMWIEEKIEGDRSARIKLDKAPLGMRKVALRTAKHAAWVAVALWTGFTFVGYFTPIKALSASAAGFSLGPWETFWIFFYAFATYGMAGFLREQVCKYMCPYARFQGVMFDPDTLIVTYDAERGEPRGPRLKKAGAGTPARGDCVDCGICVQVCPTGIDIRDGLQYECIGCSACIDACDQVMDKVGSPRGLIRYSTENALEKHWGRREIVGHVFRPRIFLYGSILALIVIAAAWSIAARLPLKVDVIRDRAALAREVEDERIENVYTLRFMNTDERPHTYRVRPSGLPGLALATGDEIAVPAATTKSVSVALRTRNDAAGRGSHPISLQIVDIDDPQVALREKAVFIMP